MGVRILEDRDTGEAAFYCSTTGKAFGLIFPSREAAELFLATDPRDPRLMDSYEFADSFHKFTMAYVCECGTVRDELQNELKASLIAPAGCTCPNNGAADCPWCEAKSIAIDWEPEAGERFVCTYCEERAKVKA